MVPRKAQGKASKKSRKESPAGGLRRVGLILEGLVVVFLFGALVDLSRRLLGIEDPVSGGRFLVLGLLVAVLTTVGVALGLRIRRENLLDIGLSRERYAPALTVLLGIVGGILVAAVAFGFEVVCAGLNLTAPKLPFDVVSRWSLVKFSLGGLLLGGLAVELIFRGYAFRRLEEGLGGRKRKGQRGSGTLWAALLLSALFGLAHSYQGWTGQLETALLSLAFFGVYFAAKRDLGVVIIAHATVDAIGFWFLL